MNNRFKFRAYIPEAKYLRDEAEGGMFYQKDQYLSSFIRRIYDQYGVSHPSYLKFQLEERLMQSTGLKDKNGVLIYEDDIVIVSSHPSSYNGYNGYSYIEYVKWFKDSARFTLSDGRKFDEDFGESWELEVVSNIYKNPNLIKGE